MKSHLSVCVAQTQSFLQARLSLKPMSVIAEVYLDFAAGGTPS